MKTFSTLFLVICMIFISACSANKVSEETEFEYRTIQLYPSGQETLYGEAIISIPSLKKYLDNTTYSEEYFENRYLDLEYYWSKTLLAQAGEIFKNSPQTFKPFLMEETYEVIANTDEFISILITSSSDTGFLNMQKEGVSFSKSTGRVITLGDILKNKDYAENIKNEIKTIIKDDIKNTYFANAQRTVDLIFDKVTYYLTETDLIFLFPVNSIASESNGSIPFVFSLNELDKKVGLNK